MFRFLHIRLRQAGAGALLAAFVLTSCTSVPISGRQQLSLVSETDMETMSYQQYSQFLKDNKVSTDAGKTAMVRRVGSRIQVAVENYMRKNNMGDRLTGYKWEFNLVESKEINAWCMPGGKVVVYSGLLPVVKDDSGLAVVMGHEIAHAVARHGSERMSQGLIAEGLSTVLSTALAEKPEKTQQLWMTAFGVGAQLGAILPFSRQQESEADHLGLVFMAMAGYDPQAAIPFWERMAASSSQNPPEFLSTHPSDANRIAEMKRWMPEAMKYYKPTK